MGKLVQAQPHLDTTSNLPAMIAAAISREAPRPTFATAIQSPRQRSCPGTQLGRAISRARGAVRPAGVAHQPLVPPPDPCSDGTPRFGCPAMYPFSNFCQRHPFAAALALPRKKAHLSNPPRSQPCCVASRVQILHPPLRDLRLGIDKVRPPRPLTDS